MIFGVDRPVPPMVNPPKSVAAAKQTIKETFRQPRLSSVADFIIQRATRPSGERMEAIYRAQELDFIRKSRMQDPRRDSLVTIMERTCPCELVDRPKIRA